MKITFPIGQFPGRTLVLLVLLLALTLSPALADNENVGTVIQQRFETGKVDTGSSHLNARMEELQAFYRDRSFKPIWVRDNGPKGKAKALLVELNRSVVHGLNPKLYRVEKLAELMTATLPEELADLELLFSGSVIDYGYDLSNGHVDHKMAPDQNQTTPIIRSVTEILNGAEQAGDLRQYISSLLSVDDRYVRLLTKIAEMKRAQDGGLWPEISADIPPLELGDSHPEILKIRMFLVLMGDFIIADAVESPKFDGPLQQAVTGFQARHGIAKTGKLDRETLDEISLPIASKIDKISINLERRRWQNQPIGARHLYVNLADGQARLVENDEKINEVPLVDDSGYANIPSMYGSVTRVARSGKGLRLEITPQVPGNTEAQSHFLELAGDADVLAAMISNDAAMTLTGDVPVSLSQPVNIYLTYVTAWANKDGSVHFRPDTYQRDKDVRQRLEMN